LGQQLLSGLKKGAKNRSSPLNFEIENQNYKSLNLDFEFKSGEVCLGKQLLFGV